MAAPVPPPPPPPPKPPHEWKPGHTWVTIAIAIAIALVGWLVPYQQVRTTWWLTMVLLVAFLIVAGHGITGRLEGVLIDERYKMSLSRFQLVLWTILILSAFLADALARVREGMVADPLGIALPRELWLLMGISVTSLVGSPLIKNDKRKRNPDERQLAETIDKLWAEGKDAGQVDNQGLLVVNRGPEAARWSDMFSGEEAGNAAVLDLGKVQMFFFTIILVVAYASALAAALASGPIAEFPDLSQGMLALIAISHAGYLTGKGITHSDTAGTRS